MLGQYLETAPPRQLRAGLEAPLVLFSDGAVEQGEATRPDADSATNLCVLSASLGACLLDPRDGSYVYIGCAFPEQYVLKWISSGERHCITEAELLPVLVARLLFKHRFADRPVLSFVDSEAAKCALIKSSSSNAACAAIVEGVTDCDRWSSGVVRASAIAFRYGGRAEPRTFACECSRLPTTIAAPISWEAIPS